MRTILYRYLFVLLLAFFAAIALDYWNFPLSPINYFNRLYPIDLAVRIPEMPPEDLEKLLGEEGGADLSIRDESGNELERIRTDGKGRVRIYLRGGSYLIVGSLAGGEGGRVVFYETRGSLGLEVSGRRVVGIVELVANPRTDALYLVTYIEKLLGRGNFDRALAISRQMDGKSVAGYEQVASRLKYIRQQLDEGLVQIRALQQLESSSYNSGIVVLSRLEEIVSGLSGKKEEVTVQYGDERFNPAERKRGMEQARDAILASRLEVAEQALRARSFIEALIEFHAALSNSELWRPGQSAPDVIQSRVESFEAARPELVDTVQSELFAKLGSGIQLYDRGDLDDAQLQFAELLRALRALKGELEMPDAEESADTYLNDIQVISRARVLEKEERWMEVLSAYTAVNHVNAAVRQGIAEARSRQGQGPISPAPRYSPPATQPGVPQPSVVPQPTISTALPTDL